MLSLASLLNPVKPEPRGTQLPSSPSPSLYTYSSLQGSPQPSGQTSTKKQKMSKDGAVFTKSKIKGVVNYPPFEDLDEGTLREVQKFQVYPLGKISEYSRHIPYNSEKKNFLEKTGRESFEVFQYIFKVPGDDKDYTVMWDYNIGLVRITPFFKCCKYSKTTPAKMLNLNPGLKEITHSITGGALAAQGYWMPYSCALAVCTTFCAHISAALIPIFGPDFPSLCVPVEAPEYSRMVIPRTTVQTSTAEAEAYRLQYSSNVQPNYSPSPSNINYARSPVRTAAANTSPTLNRRLRLKRAFDGESPYGTPTPSLTDTDMDTAGSETSSAGDGYYLNPATPPNTSALPALSKDWRQQNIRAYEKNSSIDISSGSQSHQTATPNPILSAIPRSVEMHMSAIHGANSHPQAYIQSHKLWRSMKRRVEEINTSLGSSATARDSDYDGEESSTSINGDERRDVDREINDDISINSASSGGAEKKAAWLLMKLSVKDGESSNDATDAKLSDMDCEHEIEDLATSNLHRLNVNGKGRGTEDELDGPRVKRRRAASMQ